MIHYLHIKKKRQHIRKRKRSGKQVIMNRVLTPDVEADEVAEGRAHRVLGYALVLAAVLLRAGADLKAPCNTREAEVTTEAEVF